MKKILVVDDELLVRMGIRSMFGDGELGYEVAGEAAGGREGAELVIRLEPDILLTDLVMAEGNGIELIEEVRRSHPSLGIIVLSCRNDFEYVRQALRSGADDFVFKPTLKAADLVEAFERVSAKRSGAVREPRNSGMTTVTRSGESLDGLLQAVLGGTPYPVPTAAGIPDSPYRLLVLDFGPEEDSRSPLVDLLREMRRSDGSILSVAAISGRALLLIVNEGKAGGLRVFSLAEEFGGRYLGRLPFGGLSLSGRGDSELAALRDEAIAATDRAYRSGPHIVFAEDCDDTDKGIFRPEACAAATASIRRAVESLDAASMEGTFCKLLDLLVKSSDLGADRLRTLVIEASLPFKEKARALGLEPDTLHPELSPETLVRSARSLGDLAKAFPGFIATYVESAVGASGLRREVAETRRWVLADLSCTFKVEEAASRVAMSPSHFAHVFKKDTGFSFIDFVNQARMERARELLLTTDLLVKQVADKVGIESLNHFGELFRRSFGLSPNELRKKGRRIAT